MNGRHNCKPKLLPCLLATALAFLTGNAQAQFTNMLRPGVGYGNLAHAQYDLMAHQIMQRNMARVQTVIAPAATPQTIAAATAQSRPMEATDFRPAGKRDVANRMAAAVANPADRATFVQACREIQNTVEATPGFRKNNLASALTLLIGASLQVVGGREFDDATTQGLMRIINDDLTESGAFARLTGAQRTLSYDAFLILGGLIAGLDANARESGDAATREQARRMATDALISLGLLGQTAPPKPLLPTPTAAPAATPPAAPPAAPPPQTAVVQNPNQAPQITAQTWYKTSANYSHWGSNFTAGELAKVTAGQGYARRTWQFGADGRYRYRLEVWSMTYKPRELSGIEDTGRWRIEGDRVVVEPEQAVSYVEDKESKRRLIEKPTKTARTVYTGRMHWLSGMGAWYLILMPADGQRTDREGEFDNQAGFQNSYMYGPPPKVGG